MLSRYTRSALSRSVRLAWSSTAALAAARSSPAPAAAAAISMEMGRCRFALAPAPLASLPITARHQPASAALAPACRPPTTSVVVRGLRQGGVLQIAVGPARMPRTSSRQRTSACSTSCSSSSSGDTGLHSASSYLPMEDEESSSGSGRDGGGDDSDGDFEGWAPSGAPPWQPQAHARIGRSADGGAADQEPPPPPLPADPPLAPGLYLVGTPIGNLEDISYRALRVLRCADVVLAEDTRRSGALCRRFGISARLQSYHEHNERARTAEVLALLQGGGTAAVVSDAGMPGISDPGATIVAACADAGVPVVPIPGPCAAIAALVASGLPTDEFHFAGFLPPKKGARAARLRALAAVPGTLVLYASPHSLAAVLAQAAGELGGARRVVLARELTKLHEEFERTSLAEAAARYGSGERKPRGEYVLLIQGCDPATAAAAAAAAAAADGSVASSWQERLQQLLDEGAPPSSAAKQVAGEMGVPRKQVYAAALKMHGEN